MVVNAVLPNLLNLAQIVAMANSSTTQHPIRHDHHHHHRLTTHRREVDYSYEIPTPPTPSRKCSSEDILNQSQNIIRTLLGDSYDKHLAPDPDGVTVSIELALQTFYDISETSASFTADVLMSQIWHDRRLRYDIHTQCLENLTLSSHITERIWLPFVCFVNSKKSDIHTSPTRWFPFENINILANMFVLIYPNGTVWINYRLRVEGPCYVNLGNFPFNGEECELVLESYAYNAATVRLKWRDWDPVIQYPSRTKLPDFVLSEIKWTKNSFYYAAGKWDQLTVQFFLTREVSVYVVSIFFPTYLSVMMSWISFWLDHKCLPARITLGVSALMSLSLQYGTIVRSLPRVSYIMSVDIWLFAACVFIGASLVELTIVGYLDRVERRRRRKAQSGEFTNDSFTEEIRSYGTFLHKFTAAQQNGGEGQQFGDRRINEETGEIQQMSQRRTTPAHLNYRLFQARFLYRKMKDNWKDPEYWDEKARFYFPVSFFVFNCFYWIWVNVQRWREGLPST